MLYQLSYASPTHRKTAPETLFRVRTLPRSTNHGTESKLAQSGRESKWQAVNLGLGTEGLGTEGLRD